MTSIDNSENMTSEGKEEFSNNPVTSEGKEEFSNNPMSSEEKKESDTLSKDEIKAFSDFAEKHFIEVHTRNAGVVYRSVDLYEQNRLQAPHTFDEVDFERISQPTRGICLEQSPMLNSLGRLDTRDINGSIPTRDGFKQPLNVPVTMPTVESLKVMPTDVPVLRQVLCATSFEIDPKHSLEHTAQTLNKTFTSLDYIKLRHYSPIDCKWRCLYQRTEENVPIETEFVVSLYKQVQGCMVMEMQRLSGDRMKFFSLFAELRRYFGQKA